MILVNTTQLPASDETERQWQQKSRVNKCNKLREDKETNDWHSETAPEEQGWSLRLWSASFFFSSFLKFAAPFIKMWKTVQADLRSAPYGQPLLHGNDK